MKLWQELTEAEVKRALDSCAEEPIHIPGAIQPHGLLFAVDPETYNVTHASENLRLFFDTTAADILGKPLSDLIDPAILQKLKDIVVRRDLQPIQSLVAKIGKRDFTIVAHMSDDHLIIELEPLLDSERAGSAGNDFFYDELRTFAIGMYRAETQQILYDHVVTSIRQLTGFDRVKLYVFDADWNGAVMAESRADFMASYLGMRFPATDIPEQARNLYMRSYLRLIADIGYQASPLLALPDQKKPLDLGLAVLRSVSPVHIQYLQNMKVCASMSISIIRNGKLWGLIACHNNSPKCIPYRIRMVAEIIGHIFSAQLSTIETHALHQEKEKRSKVIDRLRSSLESNFRLDTLMAEMSGEIIAAMGAEGLIIKIGDRTLQYGVTPDEATTVELMQWLEARPQQETLYNNNVQNIFKDQPQLSALNGGLLAMSLSAQTGNYIVWLRPPIVEDVHWAGNPEKPLQEVRGGYRLTPRASFHLWRQSVANRSEAWSNEDIETSRHVVNILMESQKLNAEYANMAKSEFLANMSHEIRTPMNAVLGLAHILADSEPLTEKQRNCIRTLQISADSLLTLINDLLDISKIEARTIELENIPFDLTQMTQEVISMMSARVKEKGLTFEADAEHVEGRQFYGDPGRLRQILLNLCSNAIKFTHEGGIHVTIHSEETDRPGIAQICFIITDTGIGIPENKLETIFHKFVQADNSITRKYGGTGLGLAITKTLVELMDGTITVKSQLGKGSTFTVCLHMKQVEPKEMTTTMSEPEAVAAPKAQGHILLVEDYPANVLVATTFLEMFGYSYDVAGNGVEAVERAKTGSYSVILMDVQMHGMNGFEATQLIREQERRRGDGRRVPIVGMTAHALTGDRERCIAAGMDDYIPKPFNPTEFEAKLAAITSRAA